MNTVNNTTSQTGGKRTLKYIGISKKENNLTHKIRLLKLKLTKNKLQKQLSKNIHNKNIHNKKIHNKTKKTKYI